MVIRNKGSFYEAQSIGLLAHRIAEGLLVKKVRSALLGRLVLNWSSIIGEEWARQTRPDRVVLPPQKGGTLTVVVCVEKALVVHYMTLLFLERVNRFMGYNAFERLIFRVRKEVRCPVLPTAVKEPT